MPNEQSVLFQDPSPMLELKILHDLVPIVFINTQHSAKQRVATKKFCFMLLVNISPFLYLLLITFYLPKTYCEFLEERAKALCTFIYQRLINYLVYSKYLLNWMKLCLSLPTHIRCHLGKNILPIERTNFAHEKNVWSLDCHWEVSGCLILTSELKHTNS